MDRSYQSLELSKNKLYLSKPTSVTSVNYPIIQLSTLFKSPPVYRAIIYFDSTAPVTTPTTTVKEITAILRTLSPVFEMMEPAAFLAEVVGPEKPSKVLLVHRG